MWFNFLNLFNLVFSKQETSGPWIVLYAENYNCDYILTIAICICV